jgi:hypothetical protein
MNGTLLALATYLVAIGWNGNSSKAVDQFSSDFGDFVPVVASIIGLTLLSKTRLNPLVMPFITLAVITTVVRKFPVIEQDVKQSYEILNK